MSESMGANAASVTELGTDTHENRNGRENLVAASDAELRQIVERSWARLASIVDRMIASGELLSKDLLIDMARFLENAMAAVQAYEREYEVVVVTGVHSGEVFVRTHTEAEAEHFAAICLRRYGSAAVRSIRDGLRAAGASPVSQPVAAAAPTLPNVRAQAS